MNSINNFYILSLLYLFGIWNCGQLGCTCIQKLFSINKFWENVEVFLNFSTFCWYSDFLSTVSLIITTNLSSKIGAVIWTHWLPCDSILRHVKKHIQLSKVCSITWESILATVALNCILFNDLIIFVNFGLSFLGKGRIAQNLGVQTTFFCF